MGGSGGGGGSFVSSQLRSQLLLERQAAEDAAIAGFQSELSSLLNELLANFNDRNTPLVAERLGDAKAALSGELEGSFDQLFGGSVAKHTYVDGLSDIDCLVTITDSDLEGHPPSAALDQMTKILADAIPAAKVTHGRMAVSIEYGDGMLIQLLPVLKDKSGNVRVPSSRSEDWSKINPTTFTQVLTQRNNECGKKLVPTIKLAKAVIAGLPDEHKLSGYHVESLAIEAFRGYDGPKTSAAMLPKFFERARTLVLSPIRDSTGQSVHVDGYLGPADSVQRQVLSLSLGRVAREMRVASSMGSTDKWNEIFGFDG